VGAQLEAQGSRRRIALAYQDGSTVPLAPTFWYDERGQQAVVNGIVAFLAGHSS
jgi:hypothetical protein